MIGTRGLIYRPLAKTATGDKRVAALALAHRKPVSTDG
jgi:hypothetical protein